MKFPQMVQIGPKKNGIRPAKYLVHQQVSQTETAWKSIRAVSYSSYFGINEEPGEFVAKINSGSNPMPVTTRVLIGLPFSER